MKNFKRTMSLIVAACFMVPVFAITGFAGSDCSKPCSKSSIRADMTGAEKVQLQKEEDKSIRPCELIRQKNAKQNEATSVAVECCKSNSVKQGLSGTALADLKKEENRDIRPCELMKMKRNNANTYQSVTMADGYVYGSVRANLSDAEKETLRREEAH
jgi:hypothetical protein